MSQPSFVFVFLTRSPNLFAKVIAFYIISREDLFSDMRSRFCGVARRGLASSPKETHFGSRTVRVEEKEQLVRGVFSSVASSYDVMNANTQRLFFFGSVCRNSFDRVHEK